MDKPKRPVVGKKPSFGVSTPATLDDVESAIESLRNDVTAELQKITSELQNVRRVLEERDEN